MASLCRVKSDKLTGKFPLRTVQT